MPKQWGGVARRGARTLDHTTDGASEIWREAVRAARRGLQDAQEGPALGSRPPEAVEPDEIWVLDEDEPAAAQPARRPARPAPASSRRDDRKRPAPASAEAPKPGRRRGQDGPLPAAVRRDIATRGGRRSDQMAERLAQATEAYGRDRYREAIATLKSLSEELPDVAAVRELHGLALYRVGRWRAAIAELEAAHALTDAVDQHPVLADCYRAVGQHAKVVEVVDELRRAGPAAEVITEGRIVLAGSLADQGKLPEAIAVLERAAPTDLRRPKPRHLRAWYALADLLERAGEVPRARSLFTQVVHHDADLADAAERLAALGGR